MVRGRPVNPSCRYAALSLTAGAVGYAVLTPEAYAEAHHSACSVNAVISPTGEGIALTTIYSEGLAELVPEAYAEAWRTFSASADAVLSPVASGSAASGTSASFDAIVSPVASARAYFVVSCHAAAQIQPDAYGFAYRPAVICTALARLTPEAIGYAARGISASALAVLSPLASANTFRVFYCSTDAKIQPDALGLAEFTPGVSPVRCSADFHISPLAIGLTSV